jgi:hypothetical protein
VRFGIGAKAGPAAPLTLHFFIAHFQQAFAFAVLAFDFAFAGAFLHRVIPV